MKISYENISKALVLLILATSFVLVRHVFWVVTNPESYTSLVGAIWIASLVPFFIVVTGCILFLLNKRYALTSIVVGGVLSFFGASWSYIPYLPVLSANAVAGIALLVIGNLSVLALLAWSVQRRRSRESAADSF